MARPVDFEDLRKWGKIMKLTSRCGLGTSATNSLIAAIDKFPEYFQSHARLDEHGIRSSFHLDEAVQDYEEYRT